jgi:hypothetical protein
VVWVQSQRPFKPKRAKEIADNFDPDILEPIHVTLPNGNGIYHICDGQTRKAAIESLWGPEEKVPCLVSEEGDPAKAAEIFLRTNTGRRPPTAVDYFKVSVTANRQTEVQIEKIVKHHSYYVDVGSNRGAISSVDALRFVYRCGPKVLSETLEILHKIWNDDHNAVQGSLLRGFGMFLNEFGSYINQDKFVKAVKDKWTPGSLFRDAKGASEMHQKPVPICMVDILLLQYNKVAKTNLQRKPSK